MKRDNLISALEPYQPGEEGKKKKKKKLYN